MSTIAERSARTEVPSSTEAEVGSDAGKPVLPSSVRLSAILSLQQEICSLGMEPREIKRRVAEAGRSLTGADFCSVAVPVGEELEYAVLVGDDEPGERIRLHRSASLTGWCFTNAKPLRCDEIEADPRASIVARKTLGVRSLVAAPVVANGSTIAALSALSRRPCAFSAEDLRTVELLAHVLAAAVAHAIAHGERQVLLAERTAALDQLRESEEMFRALTEHSDELVTIVDKQGFIRYVGPSVVRVLGYSCDELLGARPSDYAHPDDLTTMLLTYRSLLAEAGRSASMTVRLRHKDGSWRYMEGHGRNLLHVPALAGIVSTARDVTERTVLQDQMRQAQKLGEIGKLTGGIAHDFNNVLTAITSYSDMLLADIPEGSVRDDLVEIQKAAWRAAALSKRLLTLSRKDVLHLEVLDAAEVMRDMEEFLRRAVLGGEIALEVRYPPASMLVKAGRTELEQVLLNLVVNARDAIADAGRIQVLFATEVSNGTPMHSLRVIDNGCGMAPETVSRIFEPFFTTKKQRAGTGLGLSVVHGIVHQFGGRMHVNSDVGRGTEFHILLPPHTETSMQRSAAG